MPCTQSTVIFWLIIMANTRFLFVYGTLMSSARGPMGQGSRARLAQSSRLLGPATISGRIFDLGAYPGLVLDPRPASNRVYGELRELAAPSTVFAWLDRYEGIDPAAPSAGEYFRTIQHVALLGDAASGAGVNAWVYVYQGALGRAREIPHGTWIG